MKKICLFAKKKLRYDLSRKELARGIIEGILCIGGTAILFFNNIFMTFLMLPYLHIFLKKKEKIKAEKYQKEISRQFNDGMMSLNAALRVGYSVENAFREAGRELENLYTSEAVIVKEFKEIVHKIELNRNVEDALEVMAEHIGLEEGIYFAEVFRYAKRSGGNLVDIIGKTCENISGKLEVKEEINVLISGKKMEQRVMNIMPFGIIAYLRIGAYEFISPMYGDLFGFCVMTVCLGMYVAAKMLSEKIVEITV